MHKTLAVAVAARAPGSAALDMSQPARAGSITLSGGDVSIGCSEGYRNRAHRWH